MIGEVPLKEKAQPHLNPASKQAGVPQPMEAGAPTTTMQAAEAVQAAVRADEAA